MKHPRNMNLPTKIHGHSHPLELQKEVDVADVILHIQTENQFGDLDMPGVHDEEDPGDIALRMQAD
jgi:hypothetical protein